MNEHKEYLYLLRPTRLGMVTEGPTEQGVMILVGRTQNNDETTMGIAIFRAPSDEAAQAIMNNDPAVAHDVMTATLYPYRIALMAQQSDRFL